MYYILIETVKEDKAVLKKVPICCNFENNEYKISILTYEIIHLKHLAVISGMVVKLTIMNLHVYIYRFLN